MSNEHTNYVDIPVPSKSRKYQRRRCWCGKEPPNRKQNHCCREHFLLAERKGRYRGLPR